MERLLRYLIIIGLLFLPWRYFLMPGLDQLRASRQNNIDVCSSIQHFAEGRGDLIRQSLDVQRKQLLSRQKALSFLLPPFSQARANLMATFDAVRSSIPGDWEVIPEGKFRTEGRHVIWPFHFKYIGSYSDTVRALAAMETTPQLLRLVQTSITRNDKNVLAEGNIEMIFLDDTASGVAKP